MWTKLWNDVAATHVFAGPPAVELVRAAEIDGLPRAARRYMRFFGVGAGAPKHWSFRLAWGGRFRLGPTRPWMPVEAVQYDLRAPVARVFHMRATMARVLPVLARDTYVDGHGHMRAKLAGLVTVADGIGREYDVGELVTWLNDVVLLAPSMLLGPSTAWWEVDETRFGVAFTDRDCTVRARVTIDAAGAPVDFETTDRYLEDPADPKHGLVRGRWTTPIDGWRSTGGHLLPTRGRATWHLPDGAFTYAELEPVSSSFALDVLPEGSDLPRAHAA